MSQQHDRCGPVDESNVGRRDALKKIGVGAGVAWSAPVAMSFFSQAAAGSPVPTTTTLPPVIPECEGATCGTYTPCSSTNPDCICLQTPQGGFCVPGSTSCADLTACSLAGTCPPGFVCARNTCCAESVCVPIGLVGQCPPDNDRSRLGSASVRASSGTGTLGG